MKTPLEYGREAATKFNANDPGHFPGRPLMEGLVANAVKAALKEWLGELDRRLDILIEAGSRDEIMGLEVAAENVGSMIYSIPEE